MVSLTQQLLLPGCRRNPGLFSFGISGICHLQYCAGLTLFLPDSTKATGLKLCSASAEVFSPVLAVLSPPWSQEGVAADVSCSGQFPSPVHSGLGDTLTHTGFLIPVICWPLCFCSCAYMDWGRSPQQTIEQKVTKIGGFSCISSLV